MYSIVYEHFLPMTVKKYLDQNKLEEAKKYLVEKFLFSD
jgi:hypothetical protein